MEEDLIIIQEYCEGGDLAHFIYFKKKSGEHISEELVMQWQLSFTNADTGRPPVSETPWCKSEVGAADACFAVLP